MEGLCSVWGQEQALLLFMVLLEEGGYTGVMLRTADLHIKFSWRFPLKT